MDALDCRSPRACPSCEHWLAGGCELERQIAAALAPRAPPLLVLARPVLASS